LTGSGQPVSRRELVSGDGRLAATLAGEAEAEPNAPLLVCIHGGGCNARYFDLKGFSVLERALARGLAVLLVNRPGHGGSAPAQSHRPIEEAATLIPSLIGEVRGNRAVAIIGHSIGGAVAMTIAAQDQPWPLRAIAVSGIGDRIAPGWEEAWAQLLSGTAVEPATSYFFGREGTYRWNAPAALRKAGEPWQMDEVEDVIRMWPERFPSLAAQVRVPVYIRLAEHERIWEAGQGAGLRIAAALHGASKVDAGILPDGGHLYELHKRGSELVEAQLDFLLNHARCA
jgi:pimeloyl-ACP methyl ester carboxylesterase